MKKLLLSMVAVLVAGNTAANAAIFKNVSGIPEAPAVMNKPLLSNEGNARNKKLLN